MSRGEPAGPLHEFCLADAVSGGVNAPLDDHNPRWPRSLQHRGPHRAGHVRGVSLWSRCCVPFISSQHPRRGDGPTRSRPHDHAGEPARRPWPAHRPRRHRPPGRAVPQIGAAGQPGTRYRRGDLAAGHGHRPALPGRAAGAAPAGRGGRGAPGPAGHQPGPGPGRRADRRSRPDLRLSAPDPGRGRGDRRDHRAGGHRTRPDPGALHRRQGPHRHRRRRAAARDRGRRDDILADYLRTEPNMPRLWAVLRAAGVPEPHNRALLGVQRAAWTPCSTRSTPSRAVRPAG